MKILLIVTIFLANMLFANYNYNDENSGKIDMHGGKTQSLVPSGSTNFKNMDISKPFLPITPKVIIKDVKKEEKKEDKK